MATRRNLLRGAGLAGLAKAAGAVSGAVAGGFLPPPVVPPASPPTVVAPTPTPQPVYGVTDIEPWPVTLRAANMQGISATMSFFPVASTVNPLYDPYRWTPSSGWYIEQERKNTEVLAAAAGDYNDDDYNDAYNDGDDDVDSEDNI